MIHRYNNWKRDTEDARDYKIADHFKLVAAEALPSKVDLRPFMSPVEDQGQLGSCTGNAIVGALEYLENKNKAKFVDLSRLFVYYNERVIEGTVNEDSGAEIRDGIKSLVQYGVCKESLCKYNIAKFTKKPTKTAYADALKRKITLYAKVEQTKTAIKQAIASGYPIIFGFTVYESFESETVAKTGLVPMPKPGERELGGHAVLAAAYTDLQVTEDGVKNKNSWSPDWGDKGYFTLPWDYILNPKLAGDFWVVRA